MLEGYDVAQICLNGHVVNDSIRTFAKQSQDFCDKCGQPTITKCTNCQHDIRGKLYSRGIISGSRMSAPAYCLHCGKPFPWTSARLDAAKEIVQETELNEDEKKQLISTFDDLVTETPRTTLATNRFRKLVTKAGESTASMLREVLVDIISEVAKKTLYP